MQAMAAEFSGCAEKPPPLFELRRILLLFGEVNLKTMSLQRSQISKDL
jgi:hypothetical protein